MIARTLRHVVAALWYAIAIGCKLLAIWTELKLKIILWSFTTRIRFRYVLARYNVPHELSSELYQVYVACLRDAFGNLRRVLGLLYMHT